MGHKGERTKTEEKNQAEVIPTEMRTRALAATSDQPCTSGCS